MKNRSKYSRYELNQSPFYCLKSKKKLCNLLRVTKNKLRELTKSHSLYREVYIQTKEKSRLLEKPRLDLKRVQKRIEDILKRVKIPDYIHSPVKKRSYITNAQAHINAKQVRKLDIKEYFNSTSSKHIYFFFHNSMRCSEDVAVILTKLVTYRNYLPTGSPSSPIIAYFSHMIMWQSINNLVEKENCILTVYVDDITVSGTEVSKKLIWQIKEQLRFYDLKDRKNKERFYSSKESCEITGIIINSAGELKLPHRQYLKIMQYRQLLSKEKDAVKNNKIKQSIKGLESQLKQIQLANKNNYEI